jgi:hypothetical protein
MRWAARIESTVRDEKSRPVALVTPLDLNASGDERISGWAAVSRDFGRGRAFRLAALMESRLYGHSRAARTSLRPSNLRQRTLASKPQQDFERFLTCPPRGRHAVPWRATPWPMDTIGLIASGSGCIHGISKRREVADHIVGSRRADESHTGVHSSTNRYRSHGCRVRAPGVC